MSNKKFEEFRKRLLRINTREELINFLSSFSQKQIFEIESNDPQFISLKKLYKRFKNTKALESKFLTSIVINALLSFQLSSTGENYWKEFSEQIDITKDTEQSFYLFLNSSICNKRLRNIKVKRLEKVKDLTINLDFYSKSGLIELKKHLEQRLRPGKTINFAIKMYCYGGRIITNNYFQFPFEIEIPLDSRILKFTKQFINYSTKKEVLDFWKNISLETNIPQLHIDSLIWNFLRKEEKQKKKNKEKKITSFLFL
ncbi:MAG: N-glycosylase/DNA lyase [Candidatus Woesearchaeota archaeon]